MWTGLFLIPGFHYEYMRKGVELKWKKRKQY